MEKDQKNKLKARKGLISKDKVQAAPVSTIEEMSKILKFRSKNPKVIDLTGGDDESRMPDTLMEQAVRCSKEEKDLYMYYYMSKKPAESSIIFCNSITCTKRVSSILSALQMPN